MTESLDQKVRYNEIFLVFRIVSDVGPEMNWERHNGSHINIPRALGGPTFRESSEKLLSQVQKMGIEGDIVDQKMGYDFAKIQNL